MEIFYRTKQTIKTKKIDNEYYILENKKELFGETNCYIKNNKIYCIFESEKEKLNARTLWQTFFNLGNLCKKEKINNIIIEKKTLDILLSFKYFKETIETAIGDIDLNFWMEKI